MQTTELRVTDTAGGHQFAIVDDSTGQDIALVYNRNEDSRKTAQLLAAAPDLLEALNNLHCLVMKLDSRKIFDNSTNSEIVAKAKEAIQKATNL